MTEYIEREALLNLLCGDKCGCFEEQCGSEARCYEGKLIEEAPAADVVPVVRCRDCKHFMEYTREYVQTTEGADGDCYIKLINSEDKQYFACAYDDFCSYGERKEGVE